MRGAWLIGATLLAVVASCASLAGPGGAAAQAAPPEPLPVLAYYYIWFDHTSWQRAKVDLPSLGRYSSDDREVMRQHVRWAKDAGLRGFIVSWKNTPVLSRRLEQLVGIANAEDFKLGVIYQGLNFEREPLPVAQIAADLDYFADRYATDTTESTNTAFSLFQKPLVIWSGTWEFSREEVATVAATRRDHLLLLASERNLEGYRRLADLVDGNAYYWSSVNPDTFRGYPERLSAMGRAVHDGGGLWIAPAAPGFDARLIGGTRVVERKDGETLRRQMDAAVRSSPDAVGLISWNEFSENSHIEPSETHGRRYLDVVADALGARPPAVELDSSEPGDTGGSVRYVMLVLGGFGGLTVAAQALIVRRRWRDRAARPRPLLGDLERSTGPTGYPTGHPIAHPNGHLRRGHQEHVR